MFKSKLLGKARIPHRKNTADMPAVKMPPPKEVCIPVDQHIGAPAAFVVKAGDAVKVGQLIATATGYVSASIHSPVSGKVTKIDSCLRVCGRTVPAVRIESDGLMTEYEGLTPPTITDATSLVDAMRDSGLVGLGGAGFPTAVKFDAVKKGGIDTVIFNGAECEPYITSDARAMLDDAELIYEGINLLKSVLPTVTKYVIGIEKNKPACIKKMRETFKGYSDVSVAVLPSLYPQGAEKVLIRNTTGRTVPEGKLPADVGVIVMNVTSLAVLAKYAKTGMPLVEKRVTFDGSAVNQPMNVIVPIGTSVRDVAEFAGGFKQDLGKIIFGGPMTGRAAYSLDEPVVKTTNAIIALTQKDSAEDNSTACIHCGKCVEVCPHLLMPAEFEKAMNIEGVDERMETLEKLSVNLCMECGSCSFVCPAKRPLVEKIRLAKKSLKEYTAHKAELK